MTGRFWRIWVLSGILAFTLEFLASRVLTLLVPY